MSGSLKSLIMPYSSTAFKEEVKRHILANLPLHTKILDVGPGAGTWINVT